MSELVQQINDRIYTFFLESHDYNGIPLRNISQEFSIDYLESIDIIIELVRKKLVSIQSSTNPHIIGFKHPEINKQIEVLEQAKIIQEEVITEVEGLTISCENTDYPICLYPSQSYLKDHRNLEQFGIAVYTKMLALGEPQLSPVFFEIEVLDRYYSDPRFEYTFSDYSGSISCKYDENNNPILREEDQVFLKTFGLGYNQNNERLAVVFLRYLKDLTPEHQAYWKGKQVSGNCKIVQEYYENAIQGNWTTSCSIFTAFIQEHHALNDLSEIIFGKYLFHKTYIDDNTPKDFTFFFTPTTKNFNEFILLLDKMLSDNINLDFFKDKVDIFEYKEIREGVVEKKQKGTLSLFQEWFSSIYHTSNGEDLSELFSPFKKVRKERQNPAHKITENKYDKQYFLLQKQYLEECFDAIKTLRMIFQKHPKGRSYKMPDWYDQVNIKVF